VKWGHELRSHAAPPASELEAPTTADRRSRSIADRPSRVLVIDPVMPMYDRAAGSLRLFRILESLVDAGHEVTYLARNGLGQGRYARELQQMGIDVHPVDPERAIQAGDAVGHPRLDLPDLLVKGRFDIALISFFHVAEQYLPLLRRYSPWTRIVVDSVDLHYVRERRGAELAGDEAAIERSLVTRDRELAVYAAADAVVVVSELERETIEPLLPGVPVRVVPTVHDVVDPVAPLSPRSGLLFVANFDHPPNRRTVMRSSG
jgi:O-antigen biosynthesis protein